MKKSILLFLSVFSFFLCRSQIDGPGTGSNPNPVNFHLGPFGHWPLLQPGALHPPPPAPPPKESAFIFETGDGHYYTEIDINNPGHRYYGSQEM